MKPKPERPDSDMSSTPRRSKMGRPPRVSAQAIIEAAIDIGLEQVTLKQVADRLGVVTSALYRHVQSREELVRLAAFRLMLSRNLPQPGDKVLAHWAVLATGYAESLFGALTSEPQLINELMEGRLGPEVEIDFLEQFLAALAQHGIREAEGIRLYRKIAMLTIGAAVGAVAVNVAESKNMPRGSAVEAVLAERKGSELPHVRRALKEYLNLDRQQWRPALNDFLKSFAVATGQTLPRSVSRMLQ